MSRETTHPQWTVIEGDCLKVLPTLTGIDAVITDPPYGMDADTDSTRFSGGVFGRERYRVQGKAWAPIAGDAEPFDPAPLLQYPKVVMFGCNHFAQRLPVGTTLVWIKRSDDLFGTFLSDAELAWMKGGHGVYCFRKQFPPPSRAHEAGGRAAHPTQKPIGLMRWCLERAKVQPGELVVDPYCGSGTTGIACVQMGIRFIGIELDPKHCQTARRRIAEAANHLFAGGAA